MIITVPNPVLTIPSKPVTKIDKKALQIIDLMKKALLSARNPKGVGLAAPQIGINLRIFITRPGEDSPIEVFINPEITWHSTRISEIKRTGGTQSIQKDLPGRQAGKNLEGCLSIPNIWGDLKRPQKVKLKYMCLSGEVMEKEFEGFMATIVQHETDHLNGILYTQRVLETNRKLYRIEMDDEGKEKLIEIKL